MELNMDKIFIAFFVIAFVFFLIDIIYIVKHKKIEVTLKRIEEKLLKIVSLVDYKIFNHSSINQDPSKTEDKKS